MREEIICAGFGGQGIMLLGKILAETALQENKQLTWIPSYGAAVRGGCAFCMVVIADERICSPYTAQCDTLFVFNQPSWDKFKSRVRTGGTVLLNSTLIKDKPLSRRTKICRVPFTAIASSLGDVRVANMVALGTFLKKKNILKRRTVLKVLTRITPKHKLHLLEINKEALARGYQEC